MHPPPPPLRIVKLTRAGRLAPKLIMIFLFDFVHLDSFEFSQDIPFLLVHISLFMIFLRKVHHLPKPIWSLEESWIKLLPLWLFVNTNFILNYWSQRFLSHCTLYVMLELIVLSCMEELLCLWFQETSMVTAIQHMWRKSPRAVATPFTSVTTTYFMQSPTNGEIPNWFQDDPHRETVRKGLNSQAPTFSLMYHRNDWA